MILRPEVPEEPEGVDPVGGHAWNVHPYQRRFPQRRQENFGSRILLLPTATDANMLLQTSHWSAQSPLTMATPKLSTLERSTVIRGEGALA